MDKSIRREKVYFFLKKSIQTAYTSKKRIVCMIRTTDMRFAIAEPRYAQKNAKKRMRV